MLKKTEKGRTQTFYLNMLNSMPRATSDKTCLAIEKLFSCSRVNLLLQLVQLLSSRGLIDHGRFPLSHPLLERKRQRTRLCYRNTSLLEMLNKISIALQKRHIMKKDETYFHLSK